MAPRTRCLPDYWGSRKNMKHNINCASLASLIPYSGAKYHVECGHLSLASLLSWLLSLKTIPIRFSLISHLQTQAVGQRVIPSRKPQPACDLSVAFNSCELGVGSGDHSLEGCLYTRKLVLLDWGASPCMTVRCTVSAYEDPGIDVFGTARTKPPCN